MGSVDAVLPSRDSARIVKTYFDTAKINNYLLFSKCLSNFL